MAGANQLSCTDSHSRRKSDASVVLLLYIYIYIYMEPTCQIDYNKSLYLIYSLLLENQASYAVFGVILYANFVISCGVMEAEEEGEVDDS